MTDTHTIIGARASSGETEIIKSGLEWHSAIKIQSMLEDKRIKESPRAVFLPDSGGRLLADYRHFSVREDDDSKIKGAPRRKLYGTSVGAAKAVAKARGDHGRAGGWIYSKNGQHLCQGWRTYAIRLERRGSIVYLPGLGWVV